MECRRRPNRSDIHLSEAEEAEMEAATRDHFEELAPKRHTKPQRSEYSSLYTDAVGDSHGDGPIPEHVEFRRLETDTRKLVYNGSEVPEEFVETEYYKDLNGVDKQHHTTGTGFIRVENKNGEAISLAHESATDHHASCKGNPATNDWIPADSDMANFVSDKPSRSDN